MTLTRLSYVMNTGVRVADCEVLDVRGCWHRFSLRPRQEQIIKGGCVWITPPGVSVKRLSIEAKS